MRQTGYLPRPPTSTQAPEILRAGSCPGSSYIFQVSWQSVEGSPSCGGSKIALSHWLGPWLIQQLVLPYKPWWIPCNLRPHLFARIKDLLFVISTQWCIYCGLSVRCHTVICRFFLRRGDIWSNRWQNIRVAKCTFPNVVWADLWKSKVDGHCFRYVEHLAVSTDDEDEPI